MNPMRSDKTTKGKIRHNSLLKHGCHKNKRIHKEGLCQIGHQNADEYGSPSGLLGREDRVNMFRQLLCQEDEYDTVTSRSCIDCILPWLWTGQQRWLRSLGECLTNLGRDYYQDGFRDTGIQGYRLHGGCSSVC